MTIINSYVSLPEGKSPIYGVQCPMSGENADG